MTDTLLGRRPFLATAATGLSLAIAGCSDATRPRIEARDVRTGGADHLLVRWDASVFEEPVAYQRGRWTLTPRDAELPCYVTFEVENRGESAVERLPQFGLDVEGSWHQLHPFAPGDAGLVRDDQELDADETISRERIGTVPADASLATFGPAGGAYGLQVGVVEYRRDAGREIPWRPK